MAASVDVHTDSTHDFVLLRKGGRPLVPWHGLRQVGLAGNIARMATQIGVPVPAPETPSADQQSAPAPQGKPGSPRTRRDCLIIVLIGLLAPLAALGLGTRDLWLHQGGIGAALARIVEAPQNYFALAEQLGEAFPETQEIEVTHNYSLDGAGRDWLEITFLNSAYGNLPTDEQEAKAQEIACVAKQVYADIDRIGIIYVVFTKQVGTTFAVNEEAGHSFDADTLECSSQALPQASAWRRGG